MGNFTFDAYADLGKYRDGHFAIFGRTRKAYKYLEELARSGKSSYTFMILDDLPDPDFISFFSSVGGSYGFYRISDGKLFHVQTLLNQNQIVYNHWKVEPETGQLIRDYRLNGAKVIVVNRPVFVILDPVKYSYVFYFLRLQPWPSTGCLG